MNQMVSFSPEDVIFLLNKWDTLSDEDEKKKEEYLKKSKETLHEYWEEIDESFIFQISATKVIYTTTFVKLFKLYLILCKTLFFR